MKTVFNILSGLVLFSISFVDVLGASVRTNSQAPSFISNCSSTVPWIPPANYFPGFGPQLIGDIGWEKWTIPIPHTINNSMTVFTWTRGDPASPSSNPNESGTFSVYSARAGISASVTGKFIYEYVSEKEMHISIGDNHLVLDGNHGTMVGLWNITSNIAGLQSNLSMDIVYPGLPLISSYNGVRSQLLDGFFADVSTYRVHAHGLMTFPSGETWSLFDIGSVEHTYAMEPIQNLVSTYTKGAVYVIGNGLSWFNAESAKENKSVDAAQLVVGLSDDMAGYYVGYQATNDRSIYNLTTSGTNTSVVFAGCDATLQNQYEFTLFPTASWGGFVDSAGGKTNYYNYNASSSIYQNSTLIVGDGSNSLGVIEVYTSPGYSD